VRVDVDGPWLKVTAIRKLRPGEDYPSSEKKPAQEKLTKLKSPLTDRTKKPILVPASSSPTVKLAELLS